MKLTRERKVYVGLLGLGAAAFIADRLFFEPADAGAAAPSAAAAAAPEQGQAPAPASGATPVSPVPAGPCFARVLSTLGKNPEADGRDPFHPPASWPAAKVAAEFEGPPLPDFDDFLANHHINAVVVPAGGRPAAALISAKIFHVGDNVDGFTLKAITNSVVEFESPTGERRGVDLVPKGPRPMTPAPDSTAAAR